MYLLHQAIGYAAQEELWAWVADGLLLLHPTSESEWRRMREMMAQYEDAPMDLADASLVATAEALSLKRVFTFDRHFYAYRLGDGSMMEVASRHPRSVHTQKRPTLTESVGRFCGLSQSTVSA